MPAKRGIPTTRAVAARGFTLVEAAVAIALCAILMGVMGVALTNTITATDRGVDSNLRARKAGEALDQLMAEVAVATTWVQHTATTLEFQIADMRGVGHQPDILYQWSGTPGDPLYKSYDGGPQVAVLQSVQSLNFTTLVRSMSGSTTSSEAVLKSCDSPSGTSFQTFKVANNKWASEYVMPTMPAGAQSWSVTRVRLQLQSSSSSGTVYVQIRTASAGLTPTATVLAEAPVSISSLSSSSFGWVEVPFASLTGLDPTQGVCVVVLTKTGSDQANVQYVSGTSSAMPVNCHYINSTNSGASWTSPADNTDLRFIVFGTVTTSVEVAPQ